MFDETDFEKRAVASISSVQLITALLEASSALDALGLQIRLTNGTAQILTAKIQSDRLSAFIAERVSPNSGVGDLTQPALEVLACIAFKQPISQAEINLLFGDVDKRHLVSTLRQMDFVTEVGGEDGRLRFVTAGGFLTRFGLTSLEDLQVKWTMNRTGPEPGCPEPT